MANSGRYGVLAGLTLASAVVGLLACGEASLNVTTPTPTPDDQIDCTFRGGVKETFATRDCGNTGCHLDPGQAQLSLVSGTMSDDALYELLLDSGGTSQRNSNCGGESPECADDPGNPPAGGYCCNRTVRKNKPGASLLLQKPYGENPITHGGGKAFGSDDDPNYQSVKCWIEDGAPNN